MSFTHTITQSFSRAGESISNSGVQTGGHETNVDELIAAAQTNKDVDFAADVSQIKSFYMVASVDMLVETNDGTTPGKSFTLLAGVPVSWQVGSHVAATDFFGVDITSLFVTNTDEGTLTVRCLIDPTV